MHHELLRAGVAGDLDFRPSGKPLLKLSGNRRDVSPGTE